MYTTSLNRIMKIWIAFVGLLFLIAPANINAATRIVGILLLIFIFYPLFFGKNKTFKMEFISYPHSVLVTLIILLIQILLANYASAFYTGSNFIGVIADLQSGANRYSLYQEYFKEEGIGTFSILKIPAILSLALTKFIFLYLYSAIFTTSESVKFKILMSLSIFPVILISVSRGTFFEIFEILAMVVYGMSLGIKTIKLKNYLVVSVVLIIALILFIMNTVKRYESTSSYFGAGCITSIYCYKSVGLNFYLEYIIYILSTYFSMGIFFLSRYLDYLFNGYLLSSLFPLASVNIFGLVNDGLEKELCQLYLDCKAVWMPELISWISVFGIIFVFPVMWKVLLSIRSIEIYFLRKNNLYAFPILSLFLIYLLSLPVGKFWTVSSANILCSLFFCSLFIYHSKISAKK